MLHTHALSWAAIQMDDLDYVRQRDYRGEECAVCESGRYHQRTFDTIWCNLCGDSLPRFMTRRQWTEHCHQMQDD